MAETYSSDVFSEKVNTKKRSSIRKMNSLNNPIFDKNYQASDGRRVFYKEDGTPFTLDKLGRINTRFKGHTDFKAESVSPIRMAKQSKSTVRDYSNTVDFGEKDVKTTPLTHTINALDANGNVIKQLQFQTTLVDVIDNKDRPFAKHTIDKLHKDSFDYILAKRILQAHETLADLGLSRQIQGLHITTAIEENVAVATHLAESGRVTPLTAVRPKDYTIDTVFNPMGVQWSPWSLREKLDNSVMARHHRWNGDNEFLSLRGLGVGKQGKVDLDAVDAVFGNDALKSYRYKVAQGKSTDTIRIETNPAMAFEEGLAKANSLEQYFNEEGMTSEEREKYMTELKADKVRQSRKTKWDTFFTHNQMGKEEQELFWNQVNKAGKVTPVVEHWEDIGFQRRKIVSSNRQKRQLKFNAMAYELVKDKARGMSLQEREEAVQQVIDKSDNPKNFKDYTPIEKARMLFQSMDITPEEVHHALRIKSWAESLSDEERKAENVDPRYVSTYKGRTIKIGAPTEKPPVDNTPSYAKHVIDNHMKEYDRLFVGKVGQDANQNLQLVPSMNKMYRLWDEGRIEIPHKEDADVKAGFADFSINDAPSSTEVYSYLSEHEDQMQEWIKQNDTRKESKLDINNPETSLRAWKDIHTYNRLAHLEEVNPELYDHLMNMGLKNDEGFTESYLFADQRKTGDDTRTSGEKIRDSYVEKARREFDEAHPDDDAFTHTRLRMTTHIIDNLEGYESYQYAKEMIPPEEMKAAFESREDIQQDKNGYYVQDGENKQYYQDTYDRHGNRVYALLSEEGYTQSLENGESRTHAGLTSEELQGKAFGFLKQREDGTYYADKGFDLTQKTMVDGQEIITPSEDIKDRFVLTDYGQKSAEQAQKNMSKLAYHSYITNKFIENLKEAKESNTPDAIVLDNEVKAAFGIENDTSNVGAIRAFHGFSNYLRDLNDEGISNVQVMGFELQNGNRFNSMMNKAYKVKREITNNNPAKKEFFRWKNNYENVMAERVELLRETNIDTQSDMRSDLTTNDEIWKGESDTRHEKDLHQFSTKLLKEQEENEKALKNIEDSTTKLGHSNEQAKKKIMNAVSRAMFVEGDSINKETFNETVHKTNDINFQQAMSELDDSTKQNMLNSVNDFRQVLGHQPVDALDASMVRTMGRFIDSRTDESQGIKGIDTVKKPMPERTHFDTVLDFEKATVDTIKYNQGIEGIHRLGKNSNWLQTYDETIQAVNKKRELLNPDRLAKGEERLEPLKELKVNDYVKADTDMASVKRWTDFHENLQKTEQVYRLPGDMSLYELKKVHQDGTVIAERLTLPAKAFDVQMKFNADVNTSDTMTSLQRANNALFLDENDKVLELSSTQKDEISRARSVFVETTSGTEDAKVLRKANLEQSGLYKELLKGNIAVSRAAGTTGKVKLSSVNKELLDVVYARAGWMVRGDDAENVASNVNFAMMKAVESTADQGGKIGINLADGGKYFDQQFEDEFVKQLHRVHFQMSDVESNPTDRLILDVAQQVGQYAGNPNQEDFEHRLIAETNRVLKKEAGDVIMNEHSYYSDALKDGYVAKVVHDQLDEIKSVSSDTLFHLKDNRNNGADLGDNLDDRDSFNIDDEASKVSGLREQLSQIEATDMTGDDAKDALDKAKSLEDKSVHINRESAGEHVAAISRGVEDLRMIGRADTIENVNGKKFTAAREAFGDAPVENMLHQLRKGGAEMPTSFQLLSKYFTHNMVPEIGADASYEMMKEMFGQGMLKEEHEAQFFNQAFSEMKTPNITTPERLQSYVELGEAMPQLEMKVSLNTSELKRLSPEMTDMLPEHEEFDIFTGKKGDLLARGRSTNKVFEVTGTKKVIDKEGHATEEKIRKYTPFHSETRSPDWNARVKRGWIQDGTKVEAPDGALPLAMNTPYNSNRITRHAGGGFTSSSDIGTRQWTEAVRNGSSFTGLDFETTGFLNSKWLQDRGLVLPTELFMERGHVGPKGKYVPEESKHLFLDLGKQLDNTGVAVNDIVKTELGGMKLSDFTQELGYQGPGHVAWQNLPEEHRQQIMGNDKISFLRNIGKYSTDSSNRDVLDFDKTKMPVDFDSSFKQLVHHATIGLEQLSKGAGKADAIVTDSLKDFMGHYADMTNDQILLMQNGAEADLPWAKHFADKADVGIEKQPKMIEMMHTSRMLDPSAKSHSLASIVDRRGTGAVKKAYASGSHLADVDTGSMNRVYAESMLPETANDSVDWVRPDDTLVKVGSRGGNKIPHDVYTVMNQGAGDVYNPDTNMFQLHLGIQEQDGNVRIETVQAPTLQELQRNVSQNYKGFHDPAEAKQFLQDLTFDDAREDISRANLSYDSMVRERNRAETSSGLDTGLDRLKQRYDQLQQAQGPDFGQHPGDLSQEDKKILDNSHLFDEETYDNRVSPDYSDRQVRAMQHSRGYFNSEDAQMRMQFMGDVEDLKSAGTVTPAQGRDLVSQYNERIKQKAAALKDSEGNSLDAGYRKRAVPGLVDLGRLAGDEYGGASGQPLTALANTYEQAEQSLWNTVDKFKGTTDPKLHGDESAWKRAAIPNMIQYLKKEGIMAPDSGNRMEDAVEAVMARHQEVGDHVVDDISRPLIRGPRADDMRQIFADAHENILAEAKTNMAERPDQLSTYEATQQMRKSLEDQGLNASRMNYRMAGEHEAQHLPLEGEYALRHANDIHNELSTLQPNERDQAKDLWKEIYNRATGDYSDREDARGHLGWNSTPDNYIHPFDVGDYQAGTKYSDMDLGRGINDENNTVNRIRTRTSFDALGEEIPSPLAARAGEYVEGLRDGSIAHSLTPPEPEPAPYRAVVNAAEDMDTTAREAINGSPYMDEWDWDRPEGRNRPVAAIENAIFDTRKKASTMAKGIIEGVGGKGVVGLIAAGAGAAFVARQWTRGDLAEERPEHNSSKGTEGGYGGSGMQRETATSAPYQGPAPSGKTYLTGDQGGVAVQVSAKNTRGVSQDSIGNAVHGAMGGNANINVNHHDNTSNINAEWLQEKFGELLDTGYVK